MQLSHVDLRDLCAGITPTRSPSSATSPSSVSSHHTSPPLSRAALASHPALDGDVDVVALVRGLGTVAQTSAQLEATWRLFTAMGRSQLALLETFTGMPVEYWRRMENASWRVWAASRLDDGKTRGRSKSFQTLLKPAAPAAPASLGHAILRGRGGFLAEETLRTVVLRRLTTARRHRRHRLSGGASAWAELRAAEGLLAAPRRALRLGGYADEEAEAEAATAAEGATRFFSAMRIAAMSAALNVGELLDTEIDRLTGGGGARADGAASGGGGGGALRTPILLRRQSSQPVVFPRLQARPTSGEALPVDLDGAPVALPPGHPLALAPPPAVVVEAAAGGGAAAASAAAVAPPMHIAIAMSLGCGGFAGVVARAVVHPLDTLRILQSVQTTESVGAVMMSEVRADLGGTTEAIRDVSISELRSGEARLSQIMGEEITPLLSQAAANFRTATSHWWQSALVVADEGSRALKRAIRTAPFTQELGGELAAANPVAELSQLSRSVGILYRGYGLSVGGAYPVFAVYFGAYEASKTAVASWIGGGGERGDGINGVVTGDGVKTMYRRDSRDGSVTVHVHQRGGGASSSDGGTPKLVPIAAGFMAECAAASLWLPWEVVRQRIQLASGPSPSFYGAAQEIVAESGVRGLYAGAPEYMMLWGTFSPLMFLLYEQGMQWLAKDSDGNPKPPSLPASFAVGCAAGVVASIVTSPLDVVKTRIQTQTPQSVVRYTGMLHGLTEISKREGPAALFRGTGARAATMGLTVGLMMSTYSTLKNHVARRAGYGGPVPAGPPREPRRRRLFDKVSGQTPPEAEAAPKIPTDVGVYGARMVDPWG